MYEVNVKDYAKNFLGKLETVASYQKSTFYILRSRYIDVAAVPIMALDFCSPPIAPSKFTASPWHPDKI
jgi:hypothetical protein